LSADPLEEVGNCIRERERERERERKREREYICCASKSVGPLEEVRSLI